MEVELTFAERPATPPQGDVLTLPDGRTITESAFYQERDNRTLAGGGYPRAQVPVAVACTDGVLDSGPGQTALLWAASMVRRSGKPFAAVRLVGPLNAGRLAYHAHLHAADGLETLGDAVDVELTGADPFAPYAWEKSDDPRALADIEHVIWLGRPAANRAATEGTHEVVVEARGWVVRIEERGGSAGLRDGDVVSAIGLVDASPAAVIAGVAFATASVFREAQRASAPPVPTEPPDSKRAVTVHRYWYSVDTGDVTTDPDVGDAWIAQGSSAPTCAPWNGESTGKPCHPGPLVIVSAGGLAGNFAQILGASWLRVEVANITDPDLVDISNLNRLIGVLLSDAGSPKVDVAGRALSSVITAIQAQTTPYEAWALANRSVLDAPTCVAVVGVDQLLTRLEAQADWPAVIFNGSTAGTSWHLSAHHRGFGACMGCLFAASQRTYAETRGPEACGAVGGMHATRVAVPAPVMASYPFTSVSAAASLAARVIRLIWERDAEAGALEPAHGAQDRSPSSVTAVHRLNAIHPAMAMTSLLGPHEGCLLVCGHLALDTFFGRPARTAVPERSSELERAGRSDDQKADARSTGGNSTPRTSLDAVGVS